MQLGILYTIRTDPTRDFLDAIAQNAMDTVELTPEGFQGRRFRLTDLLVVSKEALDWEVWLWAKASYAPATPGAAQLLGFWSLPASGAKRIGGAGLYYYFTPLLDGFYEDLGWAESSQGPNPTPPAIHLGLVNRSAAAKTAGENGAVLIQMHVDLTLGQ